MPYHATIVDLKRIRSKQPWMVLSAAETFCLAHSNHPSISHFYSFKASDSPTKTLAVPDGCVDILFDCDATYPSARVFGTPIEAIEADIKNDHRYFGVRFASGTVPDWMAISAGDLVQHGYNLLELAPHVESLFEGVIENSDFAARVALCQGFFEPYAARSLSSLTQAVTQCIFDRQGNIRMDELSMLTDYTTRTIQRVFRADMGMSPKRFSRIVRCQSAIYSIHHNHQMTLSDMAHNLGFSDQSHFLREFKKLVHATPMDYKNQVQQSSYIGRIECY